MAKEPGVEHRDPQYFGYYAMLQHQVRKKNSSCYSSIWYYVLSCYFVKTMNNELTTLFFIIIII
jgi:hypothetical protein